MRFTIISTKPGHQPPQSSCDFYAPGGTIGRGTDNNLVLPDGGKPRLFIHKDSQARAIQGAAEAAKAYEQANNHSRVPFPLAPTVGAH